MATSTAATSTAALTTDTIPLTAALTPDTIPSTGMSGVVIGIIATILVIVVIIIAIYDEKRDLPWYKYAVENIHIKIIIICLMIGSTISLGGAHNQLDKNVVKSKYNDKNYIHGGYIFAWVVFVIIIILLIVSNAKFSFLLFSLSQIVSSGVFLSNIHKFEKTDAAYISELKTKLNEINPLYSEDINKKVKDINKKVKDIKDFNKDFNKKWVIANLLINVLFFVINLVYLFIENIKIKWFKELLANINNRIESTVEYL